LLKKKKFIKEKDPVTTILMEHLYRCIDRREAEQILNDPYAEDELIRHLEERYGAIDDF
jgi:hypothetical protein